MQRYFLTFFLLAFTLAAAAQVSRVDSIQTLRIDTLSGYVSALRKIKISGYVQIQWQKADSAGIATPAGGNFPRHVDNRFTVRRGRFKLEYKEKTFHAVFQIDGSERGVFLRDCYADISIPGADSLLLKGGYFFRPFGFEIFHVSPVREAPERGRVTQTLLPGDHRDIGVSLIFKRKYWRAEAGIFNGDGAADFDSHKDFIGKFNVLPQPFGIAALSGGVSFYNGGVRQGTNKAYDFEDGKFVLQDTLTALGKQATRRYFGADAQLRLKFPFGVGTLRGEMMVGTQPGGLRESFSPGSSALPEKVVYVRPFQAGIFSYSQQFGKSPLHAVLKFDRYDPNREIAGNEATTEGDLKYDTWGFGFFYPLKNVAFWAYYDWVKNETSDQLPNFRKDLKDNVLTLRLQVRY